MFFDVSDLAVTYDRGLSHDITIFPSFLHLGRADT